jgi:hypothetical protein
VNSLFRGASSLHFLNDQARRRSDIPPSNQQQIAAAARRDAAPRDYPQHSNEDILRGMSPAAPGPESPLLFGSDDDEGHRGVPAAMPAIQRGGARGDGREDPDNDDGDDDEDLFEEDERQVPAGKRREIEAALPAPKRQRTETTQPRPAIPSSSAAIPNNMGPPPPPPPRSSLPARRGGLSSSNRSSNSILPLFPSHRKRFPWTDRDCNLLLDRIARYQAGWSNIRDAGGWDYPRGQFGYRDKARNMKLEYLAMDAVLPPAFDLVYLGKKEIERLISLGKNPFRRERDLDEWGRPFGTEYVPESTG